MTSTLLTCTSSSRPSSPAAGDTLFETDTNKIITYDGSAWRLYNSDGSVGYALDSTRILSVGPLFHFDAEKINGTDTSGNPSNAAAFTGQWTSRVNGKTTVAQGTASKQPTYYTSGENSKPYLSFDGGDRLDLTEREYCGTDLTVLVVGQGATNGGFNPLGTNGADVDTSTTSFKLGTGGIFYGYSTAGVLLFFNDATQGYPGVTTHASGKDFSGETRSVIFKKNSTSGTCFIDGDNASTPSLGANDNDVRFGNIGQSGIYMNGKIYEVALFNSELSDADLNLWNAYVTAKYAAGSGAMESQVDF